MSIDGEVVATTSRGLVGAGRERARQDVVDVGGDHQPVDRQAHAHGDVAGIDVAEIAGRHRERDLAMRRAERDRGGEVVDRLRDDARPVDRVDAGQRHPIAKSVVVEQALHDRLAVVEGAFDRERVDVVVGGRGHHAPLHVGDAPVREQHEDVGAAAAAERLDRRAAGVAGGRHHHRGALAARGQHVIHQPAQKLHRQVLEGERRAVEELEHEIVGAVLRQRRHRRMAEAAVGLARHAGEVVLGNRVADERPDHLDRHLGIGPPGERRDGFGVEPRPGFRHIEAAVAGEPRERHVDKTERRSLAAGGYVTHGRPSGLNPTQRLQRPSSRPPTERSWTGTGH